jgi:hypothetical protein
VFQVTRHGKPFVRITSAELRLDDPHEPSD